jgi:pimeloyl-ACP methyl ester carboxylesterase
MTISFTRTHTLDIGGVSTHVAEVGEGPPILFLHGNPDTHAVWNDVVAHLGTGHRCIAPDLPGFGRSVAPADFDVSLTAQSRWVQSLLDALDLPHAHLVVHDVGGTYGLAFAAEHADRILSLTIFNTNFFPDYRWHFWGRVWRTPVLGELAMAIGNEWLFVRETKKGSPGVTREYARAAWAEYTPETRRMVLRLYREADPEKLRGWDERMLHATERLLKQVLWGDLDPYIPPRFADRYGVPARHFEQCGHWLMLDRPDKIADLVGRLVAQA